MDKRNLENLLLVLDFYFWLHTDPGFGEFHPLSTTHLNVCKPWDNNSELYLLTLKFIKHCIMLDPLTRIMKAGNVVHRWWKTYRSGYWTCFNYHKFTKANDKSQDSIIKLPYFLPINSYMYNIFFIYHRNLWHYESG